MNKNILMVCYYYPPLADVGCRRSVAFSKYLKKYGWNPFVLSVKNPDKAYCVLGEEKPPPEIPVEYAYSIANVYKVLGKLNGLVSRVLRLLGVETKRNYFYDLFCIPDYFWGWIPLSLIKGLSLIKRFRVGMIYVSCSPFSSALVGTFLKRLTQKPLVLDFRDPFALETLSFLGIPKFRKRLNRRIETYLLEHTDVFVVTTEETRQAYIQQYPAIKENIFTVHNGFDALYASSSDSIKYPKFTIIYTGEFYFYALNSTTFFEALSLLKANGKIGMDNFQFLFYGEGSRVIGNIARQFGVEGLVAASPRIPYQEVRDAISKSHLQLLRIVKPMISTKLFEGIPLNTPFLATIPPGEVEEIIRKYSPSSYIVNEESGEKVADAILDAMSKYGNNEIRNNHVQEFCHEFSRENLTLKLIKIVEEKLAVQRPIRENY